MFTTPGIQANQTSSIGAVWPPEPTTYDRIRGFYDQGVIDSPQSSQSFAKLFHDQNDLLAAQSVNTRLSIRMLAHASQLRTLESLGVTLEAAIPLAHTHPDMVLAYCGSNVGSRIVGRAQLEAHSGLLQLVTTEFGQDLSGNNEATLNAASYEPQIVNGQPSSRDGQALAAKFLDMYSVFGYDGNDVDTLLNNQANTIVYVEDQGQIISTAMAERANIPIQGFGILKLVEITEACTRPEFRGRGLYKAISGLLTERLVSKHQTEPVHGIYGESNLAMMGVLIAAQQNGRRFSHFDREAFGLSQPGFGILPQNFSVDDNQEQRPYNDFAVSYVPLQSRQES